LQRPMEQPLSSYVQNAGIAAMSNTKAIKSESTYPCICPVLYRYPRFIENGRAAEICAQSMVTDLPSSFGDTYAALCGIDMARKAAENCYRESQLEARDVDIVELHDCFSINELLLYEALGSCAEGAGLKMIDTMSWRENNQGGKWQRTDSGSPIVINPSGGLESKGHPIAATGVAQCVELHRQLTRGAGKRQ
ncbi:hypothetical protein FOL47_002284, partial [Perkinsus chesapeaki]